MAEVQRDSESGEMTSVFIEFVMMHAQQAALCLGQIPHPQTGQPEVNLEVAKIFIDQLVMIRGKTRGNLSGDELGVLNNAISSLQMAFVEVLNEAEGGESDSEDEENAASSPDAPGIEASSQAAEASPSISGVSSDTPDDDSGKKRFSKSYGS